MSTYLFFITCCLLCLAPLSAQLVALVAPFSGSGKGGKQASEQDPLMASQQAAREWLQLIDLGRYDESWRTGSLTFRLTMPQKEWITVMKSIRAPLGSLFSRTVADQRPAKDPKGLPKGDYMVIVYNSSFGGKVKGHELLTLVQESDGKWRVLTYQIQ